MAKELVHLLQHKANAHLVIIVFQEHFAHPSLKHVQLTWELMLYVQPQLLQIVNQTLTVP